jgi:hypothetical protein
MTDDIERLRLKLETKRVNNENRAKLEELRLREKELDAVQARVNAEAKSITAPRATLYAAVATLIGGILGAVINGIYSRQTNLGVESEKGSAAIQLEKTKFETGLILKAIEAREQPDAVKALKFFADAGLIPDYETKIVELASKDEGASIPALGANTTFKPGVFRWGVKTGTDPDAGSVVPISKAIQTTVEDLASLQRPSDMLPVTENFISYQNKRARPVETNLYSVDALIVAVKLEASGDLQLVLQGDSGETMIAAAPHPDDSFVAPSSRWKREITEVRGQLNKRFFPALGVTKYPQIRRVL